MEEEFLDFDDEQEMQSITDIIKQYDDLSAQKTGSIPSEMSFELLIDYFDELQNLNKALEVAASAREYYPFSAELMVKHADLLIADRKYNLSLDILEQAQLLNSDDINIYILKVDALLALNEPDAAYHIFWQSLALFEEDEKLDLLFEYVDVFDDYELFDMVFDCLKMILEMAPNDEVALYKICYWTDFSGRFEESIRIHQNIIDENPYNELAWFNLAAAYQGLKLYEKAIDAYQYAIAINEKFDIAYRNLGDIYIRMRKYKQAIEVLDTVIGLTRPEDLLYEAIGHCYHRLQQFAQARLNYRKASHLQPEDQKLYYKIALTYMDEHNWPNAIKSLETALGIASFPECHLALGECLLNQSQYNEAIYHFGIAVKQKPKNIPGWEALIKGLYVSGFYEEAENQSLLALDATSGKPVFYFYAAMAAFAQTKNKEALLQLELGMRHAPRLFRKVLELNPAIMQNSRVVDILARYNRVRH
ncbi:MAG: tetratricopeptide repeat protein [Chitinophagaceae bacterium]